MATDRRAVLRHLAAGLGLAACRGATGQPAERAAYVGIETDALTELSHATLHTASGAPLGRVPLHFRAHGMAEHGRRLIVFPRRPGDRFAVIDMESLEIVAVVRSPPGRHFYGHGAITRDGAVLLATENDLGTLQGVLAVYDLAEQRRLGEIALPGPGPHDIARAPDADTFFVALGGLETHPEYGRTPLNLSTFRSEILRLSLDRGRPEGLGIWPGAAGLSLRHLAMDGRGRVYIGAQLEDPRRAQGQGMVWLVDGQSVTRLDLGVDLRGYVSSVAANGDRALVSSKEAGLVLHLDGARLVGRDAIPGASAVALAPSLAALGGHQSVTLNGTTISARPGHEFDNHGLAVGLP